VYNNLEIVQLTSNYKADVDQIPKKYEGHGVFLLKKWREQRNDSNFEYDSIKLLNSFKKLNKFDAGQDEQNMLNIIATEITYLPPKFILEVT